MDYEIIQMIRYGFGYFIPIYSWYRFWKSYWDISYGNAKWDEGMSYVPERWIEFLHIPMDIRWEHIAALNMKIVVFQ